jgi:hypothetical protein
MPAARRAIIVERCSASFEGDRACSRAYREGVVEDQADHGGVPFSGAIQMLPSSAMMNAAHAAGKST